MDALPLELSFHILSFLTTRQVCLLQRVACGWHALVQNYFAQCKTLELVSLARVVTAAVHHLLPRIANLRSLDLTKCYKLTVDDVKFITKTCPNLQALNLEACLISDLALHSIVAANPPLRALNLRDCKKVTDAGVNSLVSHLNKMQYLNLSGCKIRMLGVGDFWSLRILDVSRSGMVGSALGKIGERFPNLFHLNLEECDSISKEDLVSCFSSPCPSLASLNLSWNRSLDNECIGKVTKMLPNLCSLELESCYSVSNAGVAQIASNCPKLENLQLELCFKVTDDCLPSLANCCPFLRFLKVRDCGTTSDGVEAFLSLLPSCKVIKEKGIKKSYQLVLPEDPSNALTFL